MGGDEIRVRRALMKMLALLVIVGILAWSPLPVMAADDAKVNAATRQVETGAKKIGQGKIGEGVEETAKGVGNTVVEGARFTGEKLKESGQAAEPQAKSARAGCHCRSIRASGTLRSMARRSWSVPQRMSMGRRRRSNS